MRGVLEAERLVLRRFTVADVDDLFALHNDPAVMRFLNGGQLTSRATVEQETLPAFLRSYERHPGFGVWVAAEKASGGSHPGRRCPGQTGEPRTNLAARPRLPVRPADLAINRTWRDSPTRPRPLSTVLGDPC
jgi:RimJ/RimL family protein N-acetyltransferase